MRSFTKGISRTIIERSSDFIRTASPFPGIGCVFAATEVYLIQSEGVIRPVRGATLTGNGPDVPIRIGMVDNDRQIDTGIGHCGKAE